MTTQNISGTAYDLNQQTIVQATTDFTFSNGIGAVDALAALTVKLSDSTHSARVGDRKRILATGGDVIVTDDNFAILGGAFVPEGSSAEYELAAAPGATFAWVALGAGGAFGFGEIIVDTIADVEALPDASFVNNIYARPRTIDQPYELDKTSTTLADGITVLNALSSNGGLLPGRWFRHIIHVPRWTNQTLWGVDTTNGNDENDGTDVVGHKLLTMAEFCRRMQRINYQDYTVNVDGAVSTLDSFRFSPQVSPDPLPGSFERENLLSIFGTRVPVAGFPGGAINGATQTILTSPSTALSQATITDPLVPDWTPYIGKMLVFSNGVICWVLKGNPAGGAASSPGTTARVSNFWNTATLATTAPPVPGVDTYTLVDPINFNAAVNGTNFPTHLQVRFQDFTFTNQFNLSNCDVACTTTRHVGTGGGTATGTFFAFQNAKLTANGSCVQFSALGVISTPFSSNVNLQGCALIKVRLATANLTAKMALTSNVIQDGTVTIGIAAGPGIDANQPGIAGGMTIRGNGVVLAGIGIFDWPSGEPGMFVRRGGIVGVEEQLYGFGAVGGSLVGAAVETGGSLLIKTGIIPAITNNAGGELVLDNAATRLQDINVAGVLAAATPVPLGTWADWNAAIVAGVSGFSRNALSYTTGAKIINYVGAN